MTDILIKLEIETLHIVGGKDEALLPSYFQESGREKHFTNLKIKKFMISILIFLFPLLKSSNQNPNQDFFK